MAKRIDWNRGWEFTPECSEAFLRGESVCKIAIDLNCSESYVKKVMRGIYARIGA